MVYNRQKKIMKITLRSLVLIFCLSVFAVAVSCSKDEGPKSMSRSAVVSDLSDGTPSFQALYTICQWKEAGEDISSAMHEAGYEEVSPSQWRTIFEKRISSGLTYSIHVVRLSAEDPSVDLPHISAMFYIDGLSSSYSNRVDALKAAIRNEEAFTNNMKCTEVSTSDITECPDYYNRITGFPTSSKKAFLNWWNDWFGNHNKGFQWEVDFVYGKVETGFNLGCDGEFEYDVTVFTE